MDKSRQHPLVAAVAVQVPLALMRELVLVWLAQVALVWLLQLLDQA